MPTDTSEKGLESLIVAAMTGRTGAAGSADSAIGEDAAPYGGTGWFLGNAKDYDREYAVDLVQLRAFLVATQRATAEALQLDQDTPVRQRFLARLQGEITRRGVIDVIRKGLQHEKYDLTLFYGTPSPGNAKAEKLFAANRFRVTRQLRYSRDETRRALDLCLFINGLPIATFELKNSLTKQTAADAEDRTGTHQRRRAQDRT